MTINVTNNATTALGVWETPTKHTVIEAMGGSATVEPDLVASQELDILALGGEIDIEAVQARAAAPKKKSGGE